MKIFDLGAQNTVLNQFIRELRDVEIQKDRMIFRHNVQRIGHIMAYEISKTLSYKTVRVQTPLDVTEVSVPADHIVVGTVFRAGLPLHQGFLDVFDKAKTAFVSAYRYYTDRECHNVDVHIEYIAAPNLNGSTFILVDPMLATGESMELAYNAFLTNGEPSRLILASVIAAQPGIDHLQKTFPTDDVQLYCAAIDPSLNDRKYIVPGLGDAGDLMYGEKL